MQSLVAADLVREGEHLVVYRERGYRFSILGEADEEQQISAAVRTFDEVIFPTLSSVLGPCPDRDGNRKEETIWWRVAVWGKQAEACNEYLAKGRPVLVEGRVRPDPATGGPRIWTGTDGQPRASYELTALNVRFLGGRGGEEREPALEDGEPPEFDADELPF